MVWEFYFYSVQTKKIIQYDDENVIGKKTYNKIRLKKKEKDKRQKKMFADLINDGLIIAGKRR